MFQNQYFIKFSMVLHENGGVDKIQITWSAIVEGLTARDAEKRAREEAAAKTKIDRPHAEIKSYFLEDIKRV